MVSIVDQVRVARGGELVIESMTALARCSKQQRILVAGTKSIELMFELEHRGYAHVAAAANCGRAARQYEIGLVDWRRRTLGALETTLDWLVNFLATDAVVVVWTDSQKPAGHRELRSALERRGFVVEDGTAYDDGFAVSARLGAVRPVTKAA